MTTTTAPCVAASGSWEYLSVLRGSQSTDLERGLLVEGKPVRLTVHHDTSYPERQSWAKVEVWSADRLAWSELASLSSLLWAEYTRREPSASGEPYTEGMYEAESELECRARVLLSPEHRI